MKIYFQSKVIIGFLLFAFGSSSAYSGQRIVIAAIKSRNITPYTTTLKGFKDCLDRPGIDVRIMEFSLEGKTQDNLLKLCEEIKSKRPDMVLTLGTPATKIAQETIRDITEFFAMVLDPKGSKISPSGVSMDIPPEIKLRNFKRIFPSAKRIGLIYSSDSILAYKEISRVSDRFGFQLIRKKIDSEKEFPGAFKDISRQIDCFLIIPDSKIYFPKSVEYLLVEGLRKEIPIIGLSSSYTKAGALISFDCDYEDLGKQVGEIALKMLTGKSPVKIEFVRPRNIKFSLNLLVAERLDIKIPLEIIKEAEEVFGK